MLKVTHQTNSRSRIKLIPVFQSNTLLIAPWCLWKLIWSNIFSLCIQIALKPNCDSLKGSLVRIKLPWQEKCRAHRHTYGKAYFFIIIHHPLTREWFEYNRQPLQSTLHSRRGGKKIFLFPRCLFSYEIVVREVFLLLE